MENFLEAAQSLYNDGKWQESHGLLMNNWHRLTTDEEFAEAYRLAGWDLYYIGIKGLNDKQESLRVSKASFQAALGRTSDSKKRISILNGLPLPLWILSEQKEAWDVSDRAVREFLEEPSVWNTRAILCRWAKNFEESVKVCERVYETALARKDYRTAGHGKQNQGDALKELGLVTEAQDAYASAAGLYKTFEKETGQSAKLHIESVEKKLLALS